MVKTALETGHPTSLRYPRGSGVGVELDAELKALPVGKGEVLREGEHATIFAIGSEVWPSMEAAEILAKENINVTVINARFIKPLDDELIAKYCQPYSNVITVEEGSLAGGFGAAVMERCQQLELRDVHFHRIGIPDEYVHHGAQDVLRAQHDLHAEGIAKRVREFVGKQKYGTIGDLAKILDEAAARIPDEELNRARERGADSDHVDEVVYGMPRHAVK
jgi:1-deoxy-D-xylulose-5-phosphate synthase